MKGDRRVGHHGTCLCSCRNEWLPIPSPPTGRISWPPKLTGRNRQRGASHHARHSHPFQFLQKSPNIHLNNGPVSGRAVGRLPTICSRSAGRSIACGRHRAVHFGQNAVLGFGAQIAGNRAREDAAGLSVLHGFTLSVGMRRAESIE